MLLSLFCGAGGLDLGFEDAGFDVGLAFDKKLDSVASYNRNRQNAPRAHCRDVRDLTLAGLDELWGGTFNPTGVIGGPPCQSFSQANRSVTSNDPRHELPLVYARLVRELNARSPLHFIAMENVPGLYSKANLPYLLAVEQHLEETGFQLFRATLNARDYSTCQSRRRLFVIGLNKTLFPEALWSPPIATTTSHEEVTVRTAISGLPEPTLFEKGLDVAAIPFHRNHWCMTPKSPRFHEAGLLIPGNSSHRSFKTLSWDKPSLTVAYGNREVHVHPNCKRRLSVFEAMRLQGFPDTYELVGSLSSQIAQVSEAVPPKMAHSVALSLQSFSQPKITPRVRRSPPLAAERELLAT